MDFMQRGVRPAAPSQPTTSPSSGGSNKLKDYKFFNFSFLALLVSLAVVLAALVAFMVFSSPVKRESKLVERNKLQAVFLNGGQVYFGYVVDLNAQYLTLQNIYYLRVNQQVQPGQSNAQSNSNDLSLVKLGCELHGPEDRMIVNREQVMFWENLKDDGRVAKAIAEFKDKNPKGQDCDQQESSSQSQPTGTTTEE